MKASVITTLLLLFSATLSAAEKPNVLLILADDLGFSDIGCYGGEIPTPHLDALATSGLRFSQFYNSARCSTTRAALLTGLQQHQAGVGILAEDPGQEAPADAAPGYLRRLNNKCVTLAEVLRPAGYTTLMSGKWHLGYHRQSSWPRQRGFDRFYGILAGACSYLNPHDGRGLTLDNTPQPPPQDPTYYTTDAFASQLINFIREAHQTQPSKPIFAYLAFNAPHWPLHARPEDIAKFSDRYTHGWDNLRQSRWATQLSAGLVQKAWGLSPRDPGARAWDTLTAEQRTDLSYRMAVYAAQVHRMDEQIGRVISSLKESGRWENTITIFLSDNGGCAEPYKDLGGGTRAAINDATQSGSVSYGTGWANASNTPFRKFKSSLYEGGISTPLIVHWPAGLKTKAGSLTETRGYLTDIMPTVIDLAGATYPTEVTGEKITPLVGRSLTPVLMGGSVPQPEWMFWEHYQDRAARHGDWKIIGRIGKEDWELYDLATDRTEQHNLANQHPDKVRTMAAAWKHWAETHQILPRSLGTQPPRPKKKKPADTTP